jgi:hypothetical protein
VGTSYAPPGFAAHAIAQWWADPDRSQFEGEGELNMKSVKFSISMMLLLVVIVLLVGACQPVVSPPTPTPELPSRILFIGDSFISCKGGIDYHMESLVASANPPLTIDASIVAMSGARLEEHWDIGRALEAIQEGNWDVVVLQEDPAEAGHNEQNFYEYMRKFDEEIQEIDAQTVLYMPWEWKEKVYIEQPTTEGIARVYTNIGAELGVRVAPVGLAWTRSIQERPDLNLFDYDGVHPNIQGTYLTTCVLYATIFGQNPVGLSYLPPDVPGWEMTEDEAAFLQRIAWETVVDYKAQ